MSLTRQPAAARAFTLFTLMLAGEVVFLLPFVLTRVFRPTLLDVFGLTNLQLGLAFSVYGVVAVLAYFAGGPLADRFSARGLMTGALVATALGGVLFAARPAEGPLRWLYGYWGLTTILLFWAALIKATRAWGGPDRQGTAFGLLDGGRGLVAALLASGLVLVLELQLDGTAGSLADRGAALSRVILVATVITGLVGALVWWTLPDTPVAADEGAGRGGGVSLEGLRVVMRRPGVWFQAVIVLCAYAGYKGTDDFSLYARDVFGYGDVAAAGIGALSFWVRPVAAVAAGWLGDRIGIGTGIRWAFVLMMAGSLVIASGVLGPGMGVWLVSVVVATGAGVYALRGLYFALFGAARVPLLWTGSAVGLVSVVGFLPDVFMGPLMGVLLDGAPGELGHQHVFLAVAGFGAIGLAASVLFDRSLTGLQHDGADRHGSGIP